MNYVQKLLEHINKLIDASRRQNWETNKKVAGHNAAKRARNSSQ